MNTNNLKKEYDEPNNFLKENRFDFNNSKDYKVNNEINDKILNLPEDRVEEMDYGIVVSYGVGDEFVPSGVFYVQRCLDENGKPLTKLPKDVSTVKLEFVEYEMTDQGEIRQKENGEKVYIPFLEFAKLIREHAKANDREAERISGLTPETIDDITLLNTLFEYSLRDDKEIGKLASFKGESLDDAKAEYVTSTGESRGRNYSVIPFKLGKARIKERILLPEIKDDPKNPSYNTIPVSYNQKPNLEKEQPSLDGPIVEPGPRRPEPDILFSKGSGRSR